MKRIATIVLGLCAAGLSVPAQARDLLFWNETEHSFVGIYLSPPGAGVWGPNLTGSDKADSTADADERIGMSGVTPGHYDVKVVDQHGKSCIVPNQTVKGTGKIALSIAEEQLTHCIQAP